MTRLLICTFIDRSLCSLLLCAPASRVLFYALVHRYLSGGASDKIQAVIEAGIIPSLVNLLGNADFDIKKVALVTVSNATSGGSPEQLKFLVQSGCMPPLCELLAVPDGKIASVALEALESILKVREREASRRASQGPGTVLVVVLWLNAPLPHL